MNPTRRLAPYATPLAAAALLAAAVLAAPSSALAGPPSPFEIHREVHRTLRGVHRDVHRVLGDVARELHRIPLHLERQLRHDLGLYHHSRVYYGPHGHYHEVYHFPVHVGGRLVYRPYAYCGGHLVFVGGPGPYAYAPDPYRHRSWERPAPYRYDRRYDHRHDGRYDRRYDRDRRDRRDDRRYDRDRRDGRDDRRYEKDRRDRRDDRRYDRDRRDRRDRGKERGHDDWRDRRRP